MEEEDEEMDQIPEEGSIAMTLFSCCFHSKNKEFELDTGRNIKSNSVYENDDSLFPINSIRKEEKDQINFTRIGLIEYIQSLQELVFPVLLEEDNIKISKRNYTEINGKLPIFRIEIKKSKSFFTKVPSIQTLLSAMTNPDLRKKWDNNVKEYKIIEKMKYHAEIIRMVTNKQLAVIPEKEFYDKRISFFEGDVCYLFSTSVPEINYLSVANLDRATNYLCVMVIKEDEDYFYFDCFNQIDINIDIPSEFIENNLFYKVKKFFDKYFEFLNVLK